jgi:hypothetical protein
MQVIQLTAPRHFNTIEIYNGDLRQTIIDWRFSMPYDVLKRFDDLPSDAMLADVLRSVGSHATLYVDWWKGTIAPMDVQPQGWTWANGDPFPDEYWWQWTPDDATAAAMITEANSASIDFEGVMGKYTQVLKDGVPFQFARRHGEIKAVEAVPLHRLAGIARSSCTWMFAF